MRTKFRESKAIQRNRCDLIIPSWRYITYYPDPIRSAVTIEEINNLTLDLTFRKNYLYNIITAMGNPRTA